jgi:hypothetical protein
LHVDDSLVPLVGVGLEAGMDPERGQWRIGDVAGLVLAHFGLEARGSPAIATAQGSG